jgi:hypothetical protein
VHETSHALSWRDVSHGGEFCRTILRIWEDEFHVSRDRALALAAQHGVVVNEASTDGLGTQQRRAATAR